MEFQSEPINHQPLEFDAHKDDRYFSGKNESSSVVMYGRLLNLASTSLAEKEFKHGPNNPCKEPTLRAQAWKPCADRQSSEDPGSSKKSNGFILISANGGLNQQRVAVCNAVAVSSLLNATLVLPRFLYSSVWRDPSQFGDIYQEEHFINTMKDEVTIVKELPPHLKSLDLEAIGSVITDADLVKEAKPTDYTRVVLPLLLRNGVVHLLGFGNRLGFDPLSPHLQLAALDFIACATADVFAMTDSGSQLSSLVSGYRTYFGGGLALTLRPNKKRLAAIMLENGTIGWDSFQDRVKKMIEEGQSSCEKLPSKHLPTTKES